MPPDDFAPPLADAPASFTAAPAADPAALLDKRERSKLRWRCRRGLLENDLFVARLFERHGTTLTVAHAVGLGALMDLSDQDLLDVLLVRRDVAGTSLDTPEVRLVLPLLLQRQQH